MPKRFLSLLLSILLILPLFTLIWSFFPATSLFAKADQARKEALLDAFSEYTSGKQISEKPVSGERYIVKFKNNVSLFEIEEVLNNCEYSLLAESESRLFAVAPKSKAFFEDYGEIIEYYEADLIREVSTTNDPLQATNFDSLGIYDAWENASPYESTIVAVLDTGVYRQHEDLVNVKILSGYDAVAKTSHVDGDSAGHGTGVIGIIAATANNGLGIAGVASGVTILPIKVSASGTTIYSSDLIRGIRFAADGGAKIINMSVGGYSYSVAEQDAIDYAAEKGCILIAAAGNGGNRGYADKKSYPASYENVISVASCDENGNRSTFSQYNDMVDVAVIGENITMPSISAPDGYITDSGTSFSCAIVSGIAALAIAGSGGKVRFENAEFMALILQSLGNKRSDELGYGIINALKVSRLAENPIVTGVTNGMTYDRSVKIFFNRGTAKLDGETISDGESVFDNGSHRLSVTDGGKTTNISFRLNYDPLDYEFREFASYCYFKFSRGTALLDGFPYKSEEKITNSGSHKFVLTDGEEVLEKEFVLEYATPSVYGIKDGWVYNRPVEISIIGKGTATLNGKAVENQFTVYKSGKYTLKVKSGNESVSQQYTFDIYYSNGEFFDLDYENGTSVVDETNKFICLYGETLVGARIYDINSPEKYLHFLPIGKVHGHAFIYQKFVLFSEEGITVIQRQDGLLGEEGIEKTFKPEGTEIFAYGNGKIFGFGNGNIHSIDLETEEPTLLAETDISAEIMLFGGNKLLFASPSENSIINIFDLESLSIKSFDLDKSFADTKIYFNGEYICIGNVIYNLDGNKVMEFGSYQVNLISDNLVFTDKYIIDLNNGKVMGSFPFFLSDIVFTESKAYLIGADGYLGKVTCTRDTVVDLCTAVTNQVFLSNGEQINDFRTDGSYSSNIISSAVSGENILLLFDDRNGIYSFNAATFTENPLVPLKFFPKEIFVSGQYMAVSFKEADYIYVANVNTPAEGKYIPFNQKCSGFAVLNGVFYISAGGFLYTVEYTTEAVEKAELLADYIVSDGNHLYISDPSGVYKYDGNLTLVAKSDTSMGKIIMGDGIAVGNDIYNFDLSLVTSLPAALLAFKGSVVITEEGVYSLLQKAYISQIKSTPQGAVITASNRIAIFDKGKITLTSCKHEDEITSNTEITGITEGGMYVDHVEIQFTHGIGFLDGVPFESGATATGVGKHILTVTLPFGNSVSVSFTIGAQLGGIKFLSDDRIMSVGEKVTLRIQYLPTGASSIPVKFSCDSHGLKISESGEVTAMATGKYTVTATAVAENGTFTTKCAITVRSDIIAFSPDSDYIIDRDRSLILGIPVGTTAKELFDSLASGKEAKLYNQYGKETDGYIGTGHKLILKDDKGNKTDELVFAIKGDLDGDGFISAYDLYMMEEILKTDTHSPEIAVAGDINSDDVINNNDFRALRLVVLGVTKENMGDDLKNPFGSFEIQTVSKIQKGDIIEAVLCVSGCKYAKGVYGNINFGKGLEFIECESTDWNIDFYEYSDSVSFYAYDDLGRICGEPFDALVTFRFRVTAESGEEIAITSKGLKATFADGCKTVDFKNYSATVTEQKIGDFEIIFSNAISFTFNPEIYDYSIVIPFNSAIADISVICGEKESYTVSSRIISNSKTEAVTIGITRENGKTEYYNIEVKRDATPNIDSNCRLMILEIEGFKLSPAFVPEFFDYTISVPFGTKNINVYCVAENKTAAINISDTNISPDGSVVLITVSAPDGESLVYRINVNVLPKEPDESSKPQSSHGASSDPDQNKGKGLDFGTVSALIIIVSGVTFCVVYYIRNKKQPPSPPQQPDAVEEALKEQQE